MKTDFPQLSCAQGLILGTRHSVWHRVTLRQCVTTQGAKEGAFCLLSCIHKLKTGEMTSMNFLP